MTLGGTTNTSGSEVNFRGYIKEFRWWNYARSAFQINGFKNVAFITAPYTLMAYWRLDEKNDGTSPLFVDSAPNNSLSLNPTLSSPSFTVASRVNMSEIYLVICPEGSSTNWTASVGYYTCSPCNSLCFNCLGSTTNNCT